MPTPRVRVRIHDHFQLELKLETPFSTANARGVHDFEAWIYFPPQLGIDEPAFDRADFYADLTAYLRFQTPRMRLERLFEERGVTATFHWLASSEAVLTSGSASAAELCDAIRKIKLFAAIYRSIVRDEGHYLVERLTPFAPPQVVADLAVAADRFVAETVDALARFRGLRRRYLEARTPDLLREAFDAIDDFISLQAIESWFALLSALAPLRASHAPAEAGILKLRDTVLAETRYRVASGYAGEILETDTLANERFVQRLNLLKKYVLDVLHLQQQSTRRRERIQDAAFGLSAAVAMSVAVALQLLALWTVGTPASPQAGGSTLLAFVALAVFGYIIKDRVKERLKQWFQAGIPRWLFDRRQNLCVEGSGTVLGSVEETVRLVRPRDVPATVALAREHGEEALFAAHRAAEDVLHYRRHVQVDGPRARRHGPEMSALSEILRLNVQRWLRRMDEPVRDIYILEADGSARRVAAPKTYRVNLIVAVPTTEGRRFERYCLVLTRTGIQRVEAAGTF